jgi:hypothetical protein
MHKILMIVQRYPQLSETYISTEVTGLFNANLLANLVALGAPNFPLEHHVPFSLLRDENEILRVCSGVEVTALHTHYLHMGPLVSRVAQRLRLPFTLRTHSYDVLNVPPAILLNTCALLNRSSCAAVLGFPFVCQILRDHGLRYDLLHETWPVIDYHRFFDMGPNADGVLNLGAALPKKNMRGYIEFAADYPMTRFSLYPIGYQTADIVAYNTNLGSPVDIYLPVQPPDMPQVYKYHSWLVYTSSLTLNTVGWPLAIAEAQASGLGVCFQSKRDDATTYIGGAGIVFTRFQEIADVVAGPVPRDMRELGFQVAARSDIVNHLQQLTAIWSSTG